METLSGKVALVTGASRGVGRGIAIGLGEARATVYVTGRTTRASAPTSDRTIEATAEAVTAAGGRGIAVAVDHADDAQIESLVDQITTAQGRLDVVINNAFKINAAIIERGKEPFWEAPLDVWDDHFQVGCRAHYVASYYVAPVMVKQRAGLIVNVSSFGAKYYTGSIAYGTGKAAVDRMTKDMAIELQPYNVAVVSIWPGPVSTEFILGLIENGSFPYSVRELETPLFSGRVVAALAADPMIMELTRSVFTVRDLAVRYGVREWTEACRHLKTWRAQFCRRRAATVTTSQPRCSHGRKDTTLAGLAAGAPCATAGLTEAFGLDDLADRLRHPDVRRRLTAISTWLWRYPNEVATLLCHGRVCAGHRHPSRKPSPDSCGGPVKDDGGREDGGAASNGGWPARLAGHLEFATITPLERPTTLAGKTVLSDAEAAVQEQEAAQRNVDRAPKPGDTGAYNRFWLDYGTKVVGTRRTSLVSDPSDGRIPPLTPEAQRVEAARVMAFDQAANPEDRDLSERCIAGFNAGPPMVPSAYNNNMQLFQTRDYVVILNEMVHNARIIPLDGRPHLHSRLRQWSGDSRGRWDGETLIIDTTNFSEKTHGAPVGAFRGYAGGLHLVERFKRLDADTLLYEFTIDSPDVYTRPWTAQVPMSRMEAPLYEYACHEGNYGLAGILAGARAQEKTAETAIRAPK